MPPSSRDFIHAARAAGKAIPAFNVPYLPMMQPLIAATVETNTLAFIEVARLEWIKFEAVSAASVIAEFKRHAKYNVRMHLDHVPVVDEDNLRVDYTAVIREALELGFDSVMVDGSRLSLEENIAATREAVALAHAEDIPCEAELGAVMGHEEGPLPPYEELFESGQGFTDVNEAKRFVQETKCDWLSVAIGNIHGAVSAAQRDAKKVEARLNLDHLGALADATGIPLVLHGGTGIRREYLHQAMRRGIAKINVGTETRQVYESTLSSTKSIEAAQEAVFKRTVDYINHHVELAGTAGLLSAEQSG